MDVDYKWFNVLNLHSISLVYINSNIQYKHQDHSMRLKKTGSGNSNQCSVTKTLHAHPSIAEQKHWHGIHEKCCMMCIYYISDTEFNLIESTQAMEFVINCLIL